METNSAFFLPQFHNLPVTLPEMCIELHNGIPVIRASPYVQDHIEVLLDKEKESALSDSETQELDQYEEIDDFLSLLNRIVRNLYSAKQPENALKEKHSRY
ncbi:MAG: hypothetical protein GY795_25635 [Desulfobacterales bacterium]|nr:hypothetical protein [Desulfobacterales bacterium]